MEKEEEISEQVPWPIAIGLVLVSAVCVLVYGLFLWLAKMFPRLFRRLIGRNRGRSK